MGINYIHCLRIYKKLKMKNITKISGILLLFLFACQNTEEGDTEKYQSKRNNIINVKDQINDIELAFPLSAAVSFNINDNYLLVNDHSSAKDKGIHIFNKNTFEYITSAGIRGKGPGEISRYGYMGVDHKCEYFWLEDFGKSLMYKFYLDSLLQNENYKPTESFKLIDTLFLASNFEMLNDSTALIMAIQPSSLSTFSMTLAKHDFKINKTQKHGYMHPKAIANKSHSYNTVSKENNLYVTSYMYLDLISICNMDGTLKYNIYGSEWEKNKKNKKKYFRGVEIYKDNIIVSYNGGARTYFDEYKRIRANLPSKLMVFDLDGKYKLSMELEHKFSSFCVDEENNRIIMHFEDRENPLGYINLNLD